MRRRAGASTGKSSTDFTCRSSRVLVKLVNLPCQPPRQLDKPLDNLLDKRHARFSGHLTSGGPRLSWIRRRRFRGRATLTHIHGGNRAVAPAGNLGKWSSLSKAK